MIVIISFILVFHSPLKKWMASSNTVRNAALAATGLTGLSASAYLFHNLTDFSPLSRENTETTLWSPVASGWDYHDSGKYGHLMGGQAAMRRCPSGTGVGVGGLECPQPGTLVWWIPQPWNRELHKNDMAWWLTKEEEKESFSCTLYVSFYSHHVHFCILLLSAPRTKQENTNSIGVTSYSVINRSSSRGNGWVLDNRNPAMVVVIIVSWHQTPWLNALA